MTTAERVRSACQGLEPYFDVQEFLTYLTHENWRVITNEEFGRAEKFTRKDQKWWYLRQLLTQNPDRIRQFSEVAKKFIGNAFVAGNQSLSHLSLLPNEQIQYYDGTHNKQELPLDTPTASMEFDTTAVNHCSEMSQVSPTVRCSIATIVIVY